VKQAANGADASLLVSKTAGGAAVAFATLHNVGTLTEATLLPQLKVS